MRIDVTQIDGYETMTPEEKVKALEGLDVTDTDTEAKYKELMSKANSEARKYKDAMRASEDRAKAAEDKLKSQMSDDERARQERDEEIESIKAENERLKREKAISQKTSFFLKMHMTDEQAQASATAFVDGDFETVEKMQLEAQQTWEKDIRADVARQNPQPQDGGTPQPKLTLAEAMKRANAGENVDSLFKPRKEK